MTNNAKQIFRQGCCVGYKMALKKIKQDYQKGREDAIIDYLEAQEVVEESKSVLSKLFKS